MAIVCNARLRRLALAGLCVYLHPSEFPATECGQWASWVCAGVVQCQRPAPEKGRQWKGQGLGTNQSPLPPPHPGWAGHSFPPAFASLEDERLPAMAGLVSGAWKTLAALFLTPCSFRFPKRPGSLPVENKTRVSNRPRVECQFCSFYLSCVSFTNGIISPSLSFPICEIGIIPP